MSGINHHSDDENQPSAAPQDTRGQRDSCCMVSRTAVFKLCLSFNRASCGAAAPTNQEEFTRLIHNLDMIHAKPQFLCVYEKKKEGFFFFLVSRNTYLIKQFNRTMFFNAPKSSGIKRSCIEW